jgi:glutamyl-tRNA reductase
VRKCFGHLDEIVLLSTCNRVEIYGTTRQATGHIKLLLQLLCVVPRDLDPQTYLYEGAAAVRHLLSVAAGLDSLVLGETEIAGQIKNAYEIARNAGLTGRVLDRLFQRAFQATKEIRTRTRIGCGAVSIKSAAVELVGRILEDDLGGSSNHGHRRRPDGRIRRSTAGQERRPLGSDFQSLSRSGHPLGGPAAMPPKGMPRQRP